MRGSLLIADELAVHVARTPRSTGLSRCNHVPSWITNMWRPGQPATVLSETLLCLVVACTTSVSDQFDQTSSTAAAVRAAGAGDGPGGPPPAPAHVPGRLRHAPRRAARRPCGLNEGAAPQPLPSCAVCYSADVRHKQQAYIGLLLTHVLIRSLCNAGETRTHVYVKRCAMRQSWRSTIDGSAWHQLQNRRTRHQTPTSGSCCRISCPVASEQPSVRQQQLHKSTLARAGTS